MYRQLYGVVLPGKKSSARQTNQILNFDFQFRYMEVCLNKLKMNEIR